MPATYGEELLKALIVLQDYLRSVILIGGCALYIYSTYLFEKSLPPVITKDLDILAHDDIPIAGDSIVSRLIEAGYTGLLLEKSHTQYYKFASDPDTGFELEFLTPEPVGKNDETIIVQDSLRAQALPWLDFLFENIIEARIKDTLEGEQVDIGVRLPTPGALALNKFKTYLDPVGDVDRKKDLYYVYYILRYLPINKEELLDDMKKCVESGEIETLASRLSPLFSDEWSPGTLDVAVQLVDYGANRDTVRLLVLAEFNEFLQIMSS